MFTPEKEVFSSRFRESTPKTPFGRKKYTPEKEVPSSRFKESTPKTPIIPDTEIEPIYEEQWKKVKESRGLVNGHIEEAVREQEIVLINIENAKDTAERFNEKMELEELTVLLKTETAKYEILKSLIKKKSTKPQIVVPYSLF